MLESELTSSCSAVGESATACGDADVQLTLSNALIHMQHEESKLKTFLLVFRALKRRKIAI